jgi:hypothetical protein
MPPAKPRTFYWFFGFWALVTILGIVTPGVPPGGASPGDVVCFWGLLIGSAVGCAALWPLVSRGFSQPVWFRPAEGAGLKRLRAPGASPVTLFSALACTVGVGFTAGTLPFSETTQYFAGWRGRTIALPEAPLAIEDSRPADIYLLPLGKLSQGAAAHLAAELRRETGLMIAALPPCELTGVDYDAQRRQIVAESLLPGLGARAAKLTLPPPPRPHGPLMLGLLDEDAYSRVNEWRFVLSLPFNQTLGVVCTRRLHLDLPLDDAEAQQRLALRTKKLILRMIAFHCFNESRSNDPRSLTGTTLRGVDDLDQREDHLRMAFPYASLRR